MKRLLRWFAYRTFLRFAGSFVTIRFKSGHTIRFRCDADWSLNHNADELRSYSFTDVRSLSGRPTTLWFSISEVESITVRKWCLF